MCFTYWSWNSYAFTYWCNLRCKICYIMCSYSYIINLPVKKFVLWNVIKIKYWISSAKQMYLNRFNSINNIKKNTKKIQNKAQTKNCWVCLFLCFNGSVNFQEFYTSNIGVGIDSLCVLFCVICLGFILIKYIL